MSTNPRIKAAGVGRRTSLLFTLAALVSGLAALVFGVEALAYAALVLVTALVIEPHVTEYLVQRAATAAERDRTP
jgi:hypothetical protein